MRSSSYLSKPQGVANAEVRRVRGKTFAPIRGLGHLLRRSKSEEGQTLIEFAFVGLAFVALFFALCDFGRLFFVKMEVENAIQEAARYGSTGQHQDDPNHPGTPLSRVASIKYQMTSGLSVGLLGVPFSDSDIQVSSLTDGITDAGGPGDMMTVAATVNIPLMTPFIALMFPGGQYAYTASVTIMNEPFPADPTKSSY